MAKGSIKTTPSFVCEIALAVSPAQERVLLSRLEAARQMYNACLGLSMRRVNLIRQSKDFNQGRSLKSSNPERKVLFKRARERYEFSDYAIQSYGTCIRHSWIAAHIDAHTGQKDRSRRATNPDNYNANGTVKKGKKRWNKSKSYLKTLNSKANLEPKLAAHRKSLHSRLINDIFRTGDVFKLEKISYKAFQKLFGKSVGKRAPGMFVSHLRNKAERAGGQVVEIPTHSTLLSQTCQCGRVAKKKLNERVHKCECGVVAQRDLYSAFLAKHIEPDTFVLQVSQLVSDWHSVELRLWAAWRTATECNQPATGRVLPSSFGRCPEVEWVATEVSTTVSKIQDVVGEIREPERGYPARRVGQSRTPLL